MDDFFHPKSYRGFPQKSPISRATILRQVKMMKYEILKLLCIKYLDNKEYLGVETHVSTISNTDSRRNEVCLLVRESSGSL